MPIEGEWMQVPDSAVIGDASNPVGESIVLQIHDQGSIMINGFVAGGGAQTEVPSS